MELTGTHPSPNLVSALASSNSNNHLSNRRKVDRGAYVIAHPQPRCVKPCSTPRSWPSRGMQGDVVPQWVRYEMTVDPPRIHKYARYQTAESNSGNSRRKYKKDPWLWLRVSSSSISRTIGPFRSSPSPPPTVMLRSTDGHQPYSSQDVRHQHRPNPAHSQDMVGPNQLVAARDARMVEYPPSPYIPCDTGMFAGHTIRAEAIEIQKANVGRKCVFCRRASSPTRPEPPPLFETKYHPIPP